MRNLLDNSTSIYVYLGNVLYKAKRVVLKIKQKTIQNTAFFK